MAKYKFNIKCGAKLTSVEIEADTYEDALKEVKKQAIRFKGDKVDTKFDKNKLDTRDSEVAWQEFNSNDRIVTKRKEFKDKDARDKFINKLVEKDNFYTILGTRDSVNGSVDDFFNKMKGKSKAEVEKIVRLAKGNPNAEKAYIKWKSEAKDSSYANSFDAKDVYSVYVGNKYFGKASDINGAKTLMKKAYKQTFKIDDVKCYGPYGSFDMYDAFDVQFVNGHRFIL